MLDTNMSNNYLGHLRDWALVQLTLTQFYDQMTLQILIWSSKWLLYVMDFWHKFLAHLVFGDTFSAHHTKSMAIPVVRNWWLSSVHNLAINNFRNTEWHGLHANRKQVNIRKLLLFGTFSTVWKWTKLEPNRPSHQWSLLFEHITQ